MIVFDKYYDLRRCQHCCGTGVISNTTCVGTSDACPQCTLTLAIDSQEPRDIDLRKKRKPKKGHFRETFGEAGKKHWQK